MISIRTLSEQARRANRNSGWNLSGTAAATLRLANGADVMLCVRAFGPFCSMSYFLGANEISYRDACAYIKHHNTVAV